MMYFKESEFNCDGVTCFDKMNPELLKKLEEARLLADTPFIITSSWRSKEKNKQAGGKSNSAHLRGNAVDILCSNSKDRFSILNALSVSQFTRIGISSTFIHADIDKNLPQCVLWLY